MIVQLCYFFQNVGETNGSNNNNDTTNVENDNSDDFDEFDDEDDDDIEAADNNNNDTNRHNGEASDDHNDLHETGGGNIDTEDDIESNNKDLKRTGNLFLLQAIHLFELPSYFFQVFLSNICFMQRHYFTSYLYSVIIELHHVWCFIFLVLNVGFPPLIAMQYEFTSPKTKR